MFRKVFSAGITKLALFPLSWKRWCSRSAQPPVIRPENRDMCEVLYPEEDGALVNICIEACRQSVLSNEEGNVHQSSVDWWSILQKHGLIWWMGIDPSEYLSSTWHKPLSWWMSIPPLIPPHPLLGQFERMIDVNHLFINRNILRFVSLIWWDLPILVQKKSNWPLQSVGLSLTFFLKKHESFSA